MTPRSIVAHMTDGGLVLPTLVLQVLVACSPSMGTATADVSRDSNVMAMSFERTVVLESAADVSANFSAGDLNRDGILDLVLAQGRHTPLTDQIFLGDGRGGFWSASALSALADRSYSATLADLDLDDDLDIVIGNDRPDKKLIYLNDGRGGFTPGGSFGRAEWPTRNVSVADVNADRLPDIVVANRSSSAAVAGGFLCLNLGGAKFESDCRHVTTESATTITVADVNVDGLMDLVSPHRDRGQGHVYLRKPGATLEFIRVPFGPADARMRMASVADINGDGLPDIVGIDEVHGVAVWFGLPGQRFADPLNVQTNGPIPYALAVADLNGDGATDIVVGHRDAPSTVYINERAVDSFTPVRFGDGKGTVYGFAVSDFDTDGRLDIAVARSGAPSQVHFGARAGANP